MDYFAIPPCREVGLIKDQLKDAVLDGVIANDRQEAWEMMLRLGAELGLNAPDPKRVAPEQKKKAPEQKPEEPEPKKKEA